MGSLFYILHWKKEIHSVNFWHRIIRTALLLTFKTKENKRPNSLIHTKLELSSGMNKLCLSSNLVCIKNSRPLVLFGFEGEKYLNSDFQSHFLCQKLTETISIFLSLKNIKKGAQLLLFTYFHNFDFKCTLFSKSVPNFWPSKPKRTKGLEFFIHTKLELRQSLFIPKLS